MYKNGREYLLKEKGQRALVKAEAMINKSKSEKRVYFVWKGKIALAYCGPGGTYRFINYNDHDAWWTGHMTVRDKARKEGLLK